MLSCIEPGIDVTVGVHSYYVLRSIFNETDEDYRKLMTGEELSIHMLELAIV